MEIDMSNEAEEEQDDYLINRNIMLRNYQIRLLETAKKENSIIFLPTGAGKTLIAINVLCSRTEDLRRPYGEGGKKAFFVCTTKVLVFQTGLNLQQHTKFKIACFTGDMNVDSWNREKWLAEFDKSQVLVLTGDILKLILELGFIEPNRISLVVFDECHHAVGDHSYRLILQIFCDSDPAETPLLLGLSAVLLNSTPKRNQVLPLVQSLERLFRGKVITDSEFEEISSFSASPVEKVVEYEESGSSSLMENVLEFYSTVIDVLKEMVLQPPDTPVIPEEGTDFKNRNKVKIIKKALVLSKGHFEELGLTGGLFSTLFFTILFEKHRLLSQNPTEVQLLIYAKTELSKIRKAIYKEIGEDETEDWLFRHSSPKLQQLIRLVKEIKETAHSKHVSTIIFVHQRVTAVILAFLFKRLSALSESFDFIKAEFVVGSSTLNKDSLLLRTKSEEVVSQFRSRALNLLVSTNLLEEGIDVSACNVVINFDFPLGYPSYCQSRGRARDKRSSHYVFVKKQEANEKANVLESYMGLEKELQKSIYEDYDLVDEQESKAVEQKLRLTGSSGSIEINGITAIRGVYRYCSVLPQDKFALLSPVGWYKKLPNGQKKAFVQLPINCPLIECVEGEACANKKLAKRSAFLAVVKKLYEMGQLDIGLNPISMSKTEEDYKELFPNYKAENIDKNLPQPGTRKRKQVYKVKFADSLSNCLPIPGVKAYVHVIDLAVVFDKPELQRKIALYEILQLPVTFALISTKKLFQIFQFPLFLDMGQINCNLLVNYDEIVLTDVEVQDMKAFHFALFREVTRVLKRCQVFDNRNREHSFFVAPVEKNDKGRFVLNWDLIRCDFCRNTKSAVVKYNPTTAKMSNPDPEPASRGKRTVDCLYPEEGKERSSSLVPMDVINGRFLWGINPNGKSDVQFAMTEADYKYFVIVPNYRNQDPPQCYVVSEFCNDMSPLTPFSGNYEDFASYYKEKYEIEITNMKQPLLRVSPLYNCSNFNRPRNRKARRFKERFLEHEELLIPELCDVIPFDKRFWLKATLLPTILNRIYHAFCAEEFRRRVVSETGLGALELPPGKAWEPLGMDDRKGDEKEEEMSNVENIKSSLPLSKLKGNIQPSQEVILCPEMHLYGVGLCDLEFYVSNLQEILLEEMNKEPALPQNDEAIKLINLHQIQVPPLTLLQTVRNRSGPSLAEMVQACTAKSANDIIDYERLEILGDSFLKFAVTLFLFRNYDANEGILTNLKGKIVGNRNLLYCGVAKKIQDVINVNDFAPLSDWNPPLLCVPERLTEAIISKGTDPAVLYRFEIPLEEQFSGILSEDTLKLNEEIIEDYEKCFEIPSSCLLPYKTIEDKTISDCVEAFIGVYLLNLGLPGGFEFLRWLEVLPKAKSSYSELMEKPYSPRLFSSDSDFVVLNLLREVFYTNIEDTLNYHFQNKALLLEALTHPSFFKNRVTDCYQRLELLGDAILDFLITTHVYESYGNLTPGQVTDIRSSLVNNITFACLVVRYELHKYLLSFSSTLKTSVQNFASFQEKRNHVIDDNVVILFEENDCLIAETVQVPKALGDLFESLAGAIYLDSGNSLETVWKVYYALMKREIDEFTKNIPKSAVRLLQEICGEKPYYETITIGKNVKVSCCVYYENQEIKAHGFGLNKKEAKKSASKLVLNKILALKK